MFGLRGLGPMCVGGLVVSGCIRVCVVRSAMVLIEWCYEHGLEV